MAILQVSKKKRDMSTTYTYWLYRKVHLAAILSISDLPDGRVELDVQALAERHGDAAVPIPYRQVGAWTTVLIHHIFPVTPL
jgi:hypothetical protein